MPSFWLVAILSCIRNAFFGLVYSLCQKIIGCIPYTEIWSSQISNKLFLNLETSTRWHSLFFPKSQLVVPYTAFLVRDNACIFSALSWSEKINTHCSNPRSRKVKKIAGEIWGCHENGLIKSFQTSPHMRGLALRPQIHPIHFQFNSFQYWSEVGKVACFVMI